MTFQAGQSGNPGGRSRKEKPFRDALILALKDVDASDKSKLRQIAEQHIAKALAGDVQAIKEIYDRVDGKVPQPNTHSGDEDGNPIEMALSGTVTLIGSKSQPA